MYIIEEFSKKIFISMLFFVHKILSITKRDDKNLNKEELSCFFTRVVTKTRWIIENDYLK